MYMTFCLYSVIYFFLCIALIIEKSIAPIKAVASAFFVINVLDLIAIRFLVIRMVSFKRFFGNMYMYPRLQCLNGLFGLFLL